MQTFLQGHFQGVETQEEPVPVQPKNPWTGRPIRLSGHNADGALTVLLPYGPVVQVTTPAESTSVIFCPSPEIQAESWAVATLETGKGASKLQHPQAYGPETARTPSSQEMGQLHKLLHKDETRFHLPEVEALWDGLSGDPAAKDKL